MLSQLYLIRHGETAWSLSGQHTGRTDIPLTPKGEKDALQLAKRLRAVHFTEVLSSPRVRARQTCELAGFGSQLKIEADLAEWDYGDYEGLRSTEIRERQPGWNIYRDGCPHGELPVEVRDRADRLIVHLRTLSGNVAVFSHGHFGRVLAARWIDVTLEEAERFSLSPASVSILAYEHDDPAAPVIALWNEVR